MSITKSVEEESKVFSTVRKGGRCFNGAHRDGGVIIHIVCGTEPNGFWAAKALCGTQPGQRGYGWSSTQKQATCEKCIKRLNEQNKTV